MHISHIPQYHFKMIRYYGFLSNRKRGRLLPLVYLALETPASNNLTELTYAKQHNGFTGNGSYECFLCGGRVTFAGFTADSKNCELIDARRMNMRESRQLGAVA